jgi:hypothetical protein
MKQLGGNRFSGTIGTLLKGEPIMGDSLPPFVRHEVVLLRITYIIARRGTIFTSGDLSGIRTASEA